MARANVEQVVNRYTEGARSQVAELCCPIDCSPKYFEVTPDEVLRHDHEAAPFDCWRTALRHPREEYAVTSETRPCCEPGDGRC